MIGAVYVRVAVPAPVDGPLTYAVPDDLLEQVDGVVRPGHALLVPFGTRKLTGWVVEVLEAPDLDPARIREVERFLDPVPVADPAQLDFFRWAARYYASGLGEVMATALPVATRVQTRRVWLPEPAGSEALGEERVPEPLATVLREVIRRPGLTTRGLVGRLVPEHPPRVVAEALARLRKDGMVRGANRESGQGRDKVEHVRLAAPAAEMAARAPRAGPRMKALVARLEEAGGEAELPDLVSLVGEPARDAARRLQALGVVTVEVRERRDPVAAGALEGAPREPLPPTPDQARALEVLQGAESGTFLLHGVTGSGKTEVYLQAAAGVLEQGRQVLLLVPEIGLTPQLVGRVRARFGDRVAVMHSGLTGVERLRSWRRARSGDARVVVGARSALFAPFRNLGLLVVDEEHDDSYKQGEGVRYHARDLAVVRGTRAPCPVLLGSATPSMESLHNAREGRYHLLTLATRVGGAAPPTVELVDMAREPREDGKVPLLSRTLREALGKVVEGDGQAILLHHRRGWATVTQCPDCGGRYTCPSCGISLVLHRRARKLLCHYCGFQRPARPDCERCGVPLEVLGEGSEKLEDVLKALYPWTTVARMDAETTAARGAHHRILESFRAGRIRILVGTQVVAKGHDFPGVELAAAVSVDTPLTLPDFRSAERTRALVTQLAGRAGRGARPGRVLVQTHHPDHFVFRHLDDPEAFYTREARLRRTLGYPPYARLVLLRLEGVDHDATRELARELAGRLREHRPPGRVVDVLGPAPAPLARLVGRWRYQVVIRGNEFAPFRRWLEARLPELRVPRRGVRVTLDVDPRSLL